MKKKKFNKFKKSFVKHNSQGKQAEKLKEAKIFIPPKG